MKKDNILTQLWSCINNAEVISFECYLYYIFELVTYIVSLKYERDMFEVRIGLSSAK